MVTIALFYLANINSKVEQIDDKLFRHLTNDEMHSPRSLFVTKAEFEIYQELRSRQVADIKDLVADMRNDNNKAHENIMQKMESLTTGRR